MKARFLADLDKGLHKQNLIDLIPLLTEWMRTEPGYRVPLYTVKSVLADVLHHWIGSQPVETQRLQEIEQVIVPQIKAVMDGIDDPSATMTNLDTLVGVYLGLR